MNERNLVEKLKQGDEAAFKEIVDKWQDLVYNTAIAIVQNEQDAEDLAQEVFIQVYESIHQFKEQSKFSTWLYRITVSKGLDLLRKKKTRKRFAFMKSLFGSDEQIIKEPPDFFHPGIALDNKESGKVLFRAIASLPENQKIAFTLHKVEGLSHQEISEIMNTSVAAVESLVHRARANLRKILEEYYRHEP